MKNGTNNLAIAFDLQTGIPRPLSTFKHLHLRNVMKISEDNPDVEQIVTITVNVDIGNTRIVESAGGKSGDRSDKGGEALKIRKLEIEGRVLQKIEYISGLNDNPVFSATFVLPFNTFVVLGEEMKSYSGFEVTGYIRNVLVKLLDKRKIYNNVLLVLNVSTSGGIQ
jgi:hypothetical protein